MASGASTCHGIDLSRIIGDNGLMGRLIRPICAILQIYGLKTQHEPNFTRNPLYTNLPGEGIENK